MYIKSLHNELGEIVRKLKQLEHLQDITKKSVNKILKK